MSQLDSRIPVLFRYTFMDIETLDNLTKWVAFFYGVLMFFVLEFPPLRAVESKKPELFLILRRHQGIALFCMWFSAAWILQDIWITL